MKPLKIILLFGIAIVNFVGCSTATFSPDRSFITVRGDERNEIVDIRGYHIKEVEQELRLCKFQAYQNAPKEDAPTSQPDAEGQKERDKLIIASTKACMDHKGYNVYK